MQETLAVRGYTDFLRACDHAEKESKKEVRETFRVVGDIVKVDAAGKFIRYDVHTAAGFRTVVRTRGVSVEQTLRKTTGLHPEFGELQLTRALEPALTEDERRVEQAFEKALDKVADHFEQL